MRNDSAVLAITSENSVRHGHDVAKEPDDRAGVRIWIALLVLFIFYGLSFVDKQIIVLLVRPIQESLFLSNIQIALVHGVAYSLFYAAAGVPLGWAVDRFSPRWIIFCGVLIWSISTMLCAFSTGFNTLFAGRLAVGIGEAALIPAAFVIIASNFPAGRLAMASAFFMVASLTGNGIAFAAGGQVVLALTRSAGWVFPLVGHLEPWRAALVFVGLPGLILAWLAMLLPDRSPALLRTDSLKKDNPIVSNTQDGFLSFLRANARFLLTHLGGFALLGAAAFAGQAWGPTYFSQAFGWRSDQIGTAFGLIIGVFGTIGVFTSAKAVDWLYRRGIKDAHVRLHVLTTLAGAPFAIAAFLVSNPITCVVLLCFTYLTFFSFAATATSALQLISPPQYRGRIASLYGVALTLGGAAAGPLIVASVSDLYLKGPGRLGECIAISTAICALPAAILLFLALKPFRRAQIQLRPTATLL
jgi:MFS family permease